MKNPFQKPTVESATAALAAATDALIAAEIAYQETGDFPPVEKCRAEIDKCRLQLAGAQRRAADAAAAIAAAERKRAIAERDALAAKVSEDVIAPQIIPLENELVECRRAAKKAKERIEAICNAADEDRKRLAAMEEALGLPITPWPHPGATLSVARSNVQNRIWADSIEEPRWGAVEVDWLTPASNAPHQINEKH